VRAAPLIRIVPYRFIFGETAGHSECPLQKTRVGKFRKTSLREMYAAGEMDVTTLG